MSILLYRCIKWTLTKRMEKNKFTAITQECLRAILNKSWRQHPTKQQLYGHLPHITKTIKVKRSKHARHSWRSKDVLISDILLWTPSHGRANAGRSARTFMQQLFANTWCSHEDLPGAVDDTDGWRVRNHRKRMPPADTKRKEGEDSVWGIWQKDPRRFYRGSWTLATKM